MDRERLSDELNRIKIENAKLMSHIAGNIVPNGEKAVLLWLGTRKTDTYAIDIIDHFGLTPGRVANIVKSLEKRAFIERIWDAKDQRKARILLTDTGEAASMEVLGCASAANIWLIDFLGEDDAVQFIDMLKRALERKNRINTKRENPAN